MHQCLLRWIGRCARRNDCRLLLFAHSSRAGLLYLLEYPRAWIDTDCAPVFPEVWRKVEPLIAGLPLVAHNKAFDERCLKAVFRCYQMDYPDYPFLCTLVKSRRVWPQGRHNLDVIAARCGYNLTDHHHALADAEACAAIALQIL